MAEQEDPGETDGPAAVPDEHGDVRRRFVELWNVRTSGDAGALALDAAWQPIANLLDGHTTADAPASHQDLLNPDSADVAKQDSFEVANQDCADSARRTNNTHPPQ